MRIKKLMSLINSLEGDFFTGVPDSLLAPLCDFLLREYGTGKKHIVAANEGAAVGLAAGHYLATGKPAVVYMQNSGLGNAVNPVCSLLKIYKIPAIFIIGWRGEPDVPDEPQHVFQGQVTTDLLELLQIPYKIISSKEDNLDIRDFDAYIKKGESVAFVVKKSALEAEDPKQEVKDSLALSREKILEIILGKTDNRDIFVCTTGKLSREVFEIRERLNLGHSQDFLTVGSMGHSSVIACGIAVNKPKSRVFCLDGDGAVLMHMGSLAVIGELAPNNLIHIVINNGAHESVGGMPIAQYEMTEAAKALGYKHVLRAASEAELINALKALSPPDGPVFIEAVSNLQSRKDLGRPTTDTLENKQEFMAFLQLRD